ncbi:MAG TPA: DUF4304 domain-containing protein [Caulobacteraceae bacterium]|jgi:hypothetical protein
MGDELAKALTRVVYPTLKPQGFRRLRTRDMIRVENGIVQRLYFQVDHWGSRRFCVTACANLIAGNDHAFLNPGFRLGRDTERRDMWLPSLTPEEAERSASTVLGLIRTEALPYFEKSRTIQGFSALLAKEEWASTHHLSFQRGVAAALEGKPRDAQQHLADAIQAYEADGRSWCAECIDRATQLQQALALGAAASLLRTWERANSRVHGIR